VARGQPHGVALDPETPEFRAEFDSAYLEANVTGLPEGGAAAAKRVEAILRRSHPNLVIVVETGPQWTVIQDAGPRSGT